jgi:hypothetical protein
MKVRLKTLKQLAAEFRPYANKWSESRKSISITYNNLYWYINKEMLSYFGEYIEVEIISKNDMDAKFYTHKNIYPDEMGDKWAWHESWFMPELEDFFKKEEFML